MGSALPSASATAREQRRVRQILVFTALVVVGSASLALKVGVQALLLPAGGVFLLLLVATISRARTSPTAEEWSAQLPAWVLRSRGVSLRGRMRDTTELTGRLQIQHDQIVWRPSSGSQRLGAVRLTWPRPAMNPPTVALVWGLTPMCLVHLNGGDREDADIWVRARPASVVRRLGAAGSQ